MGLAQLIDSLDLVRYEKEMMIYLSEVDSATAKDIYRNTKIPQGRIYSILNGLKDKGFVTTVPTSPKRYKIDDIKQSLRNYIDRKKISLDKKLQEAKNLEVKPKLFLSGKNIPSVYTFTGRDEHLKALISLRTKAKQELVQIAPLFIGSFASNLSLYKALQRGVSVKVITYKVTSKNKKNIQECLRLGAEIRQLKYSDLLSFLVKDNDEFLLGVENYRNQEERLYLYSKNKALLITLKETFERLWKKAKPIKL